MYTNKNAHRHPPAHGRSPRPLHRSPHRCALCPVLPCFSSSPLPFSIRTQIQQLSTSASFSSSSPAASSSFFLIIYSFSPICPWILAKLSFLNPLLLLCLPTFSSLSSLCTLLTHPLLSPPPPLLSYLKFPFILYLILPDCLLLHCFFTMCRARTCHFPRIRAAGELDHEGASKKR